MKKVVIFFIFICSLFLFGQTKNEKIEAVNKLISNLNHQLILLKRGEKGVNGYAIFGFDCPENILTGDEEKDQFLSSKARIRIIEKEIEELKQLLHYYKTGKTNFKKPAIPHFSGKIRAILTGLSDKDFGGKYNGLKPDGDNDYLLILDVNMPGKYIKNIEVKNTSGEFTVWDSKPETWLWSLAVCTPEGLLVSKRDSALVNSIDATHTRLLLYLPDNGSIWRRHTNYKLTLEFTDGGTISTEVINKIPSNFGKVKAVLKGLSNRDYGGKYNEVKPDGEKDYVVELTINAKGKRIKGITIKNTEGGEFTVWDTYPETWLWAMAVEKDGKLVSKRDSSIDKILLTKEKEKLYLYLPDNGSIKRERTNYRLTINYTDGTVSECDVKRDF